MTLRREQFLGAWRLRAWRIQYADGRVTWPYGENAEGLLMYTDDAMSATVAAAHRPALGSSNPRRADEAVRAAAFDGFFHYSGGWRIDDDSVVHEVRFALNPDMAGTEQRRVAVFDGNGLTLSATEPLRDGQRRHHELSWTRIRNN